MKKTIIALICLFGITQFSFGASCTSISKYLSYGTSDTTWSSDVSDLQFFLNQEKYLVYYPTGYFGPATQSAVRSFQKAYGISTTGTVGPITRSKIKELTCGLSSVTSNNNTYVNTAGNTVHSPTYTENDIVPEGASAKCRDGTYSFSQSRRGTCSHHGGVSSWLP